MKKTFLLTLIFLICSSLLTIPTKNRVKADGTNENVVLYQAVIGKGETAMAISAISQAYYKDLNNLTIVESVVNAKSLNDEVLCDQDIFSNKDEYCDDNKVKGSLSKLTMTKNGNIDLILENGVSLVSLSIYYAIAGESNEAQVYCASEDGKSKVVCKGAQQIITGAGHLSNWYMDAKNGSMSYGSTSVDGPFNKVTTSTGQVRYTGFNLYDNMSRASFKNSETSGVYVVISYSIRWVDTENADKVYTYNVNDYTVHKKKFDPSSVSSTNSDNIKSMIIDRNPTKPLDAAEEEDRRPTFDTNYNLLQNAALVKTDRNYDISDNKSYNNIANYVTRTIIPIIIIVIGVMFIISGASTAVTIAKSADEPDVRSASIKKLVGMCIGVVAIALILIFYNQIVSAVANLID